MQENVFISWERRRISFGVGFAFVQLGMGNWGSGYGERLKRKRGRKTITSDREGKIDIN